MGLLESAWTGYRGTVFGIWGYFDFTKNGFLNSSKQFDIDSLNIQIKDKIFMVTGANSGLGKSVSKDLASRGATVLMLCRNQKSGLEASQEISKETNNSNVKLLICDISRPNEIKKVVKEIKAIDVLINNAGILIPERQETPDGLDMNFATNTLGTYYLTELLIPILQKSKDPRVITVSSGGAYNKKLDVDDIECKSLTPWSGDLAYAYSKRAQIELTNHWAKKYKEISFYSMHPGWVNTPGVEKSLPGFHKFLGDKLRIPEQGIDTIIWSAISNQVKSIPNGSFLFDRQIAKQHLFLSGTESSPLEVSKFVDSLDSILKEFNSK